MPLAGDFLYYGNWHSILPPLLPAWGKKAGPAFCCSQLATCFLVFPPHGALSLVASPGELFHFMMAKVQGDLHTNRPVRAASIGDSAACLGNINNKSRVLKRETFCGWRAVFLFPCKWLSLKGAARHRASGAEQRLRSCKVGKHQLVKMNSMLWCKVFYLGIVFGLFWETVNVQFFLGRIYGETSHS